jgi:Transposase DDE domain
LKWITPLRPALSRRLRQQIKSLAERHWQREGWCAFERRHLEDMLAGLPAQALVVADAGFTGYELFRQLVAAKQSFLVRVGANIHLLKELGYYEQEGVDTVYLWPMKNAHEPPVILRLIERRQGKKKMYLVTSVLDQKALPDKTAGLLYEMRWGVETGISMVKRRVSTLVHARTYWNQCREVLLIALTYNFMILYAAAGFLRSMPVPFLPFHAARQLD